jgi:hypothetical protein
MNYLEIPGNTVVLVVPDWAVWVLAGIVLVDMLARFVVWVQKETSK